MSVTAPGAGVGSAALGAGAAGLAAAPLAAGLALGKVVDGRGLLAAAVVAEAGNGLLVADLVSIRQPAGTVFAELATAGLRELGALLPVIERELVTGEAPSASALGHLARAVADAAHQIGAGFSGQVAQVAGGRGGLAMAAAPARGGAGESPSMGRLGVGTADAESGGVTGVTRGALSREVLQLPPGRVDAGEAAADGRASGRSGASSGLAGPTAEGARLEAGLAAGGAEGTRERGGEMGGRPEWAVGSSVRSSDDLAGRDQQYGGPHLPAGLASWRAQAQQTLLKASGVMELVGLRVQMSRGAEPGGEGAAPVGVEVAARSEPELSWAMIQVVGAQRQLATSAAVLDGFAPVRGRHGVTVAGMRGVLRAGGRLGAERPFGGRTKAVTVLGLSVLVVFLALVFGS